MAKCLQVRIPKFCQDSCATAHSAADAGHNVCQGHDSCGFQGARAPQSGTKSLLRDPIAGCVHVRVLEERWVCSFFEAETLRHGPAAHDAGEGAEPLLHLRRHVRLAPLCTRLSRLVVTSTSPAASPAASPAVACSSPAGSAAKLATPFCTATCSATAAIVHRELHPLPTSSRWWIWPQLFDTAVHGVGELPKRSRNASQHDVHGHVAVGAGDVPSVHSRLASSSNRAHRCAPAPRTKAASVVCMTKNFVPQNTRDETPDTKFYN